MKIGILTGGGDVPGLNACIKVVVNRATDENHEVLGIRRGWRGLLQLNPDDPSSREQNLMALDRKIVRPIDRPMLDVMNVRAPCRASGIGTLATSLRLKG